MPTAEALAREEIDRLPGSWSRSSSNIKAARGVALREFPLNEGFGTADYLPYVDGKTSMPLATVSKPGVTVTLKMIATNADSGTLKT